VQTTTRAIVVVNVLAADGEQPLAWCDRTGSMTKALIRAGAVQTQQPLKVDRRGG
jgi:hypothetical protein